MFVYFSYSKKTIAYHFEIAWEMGRHFQNLVFEMHILFLLLCIDDKDVMFIYIGPKNHIIRGSTILYHLDIAVSQR